MINLNRIMAYYTVVAFAFGVACALAYSIYNSINNAPNRALRYENRRQRRQNDPPEPERPTRRCDVCSRPVHSNLQLSCGHQFHRSCFQKQPNCDDCPSCGTSLAGNELWMIFERDYSVCTICLCATDEMSYVLSCGHEFHRSCASRMIEYEERCPNCREPLPSSDVRLIATFNREF